MKSFLKITLLLFISTSAFAQDSVNYFKSTSEFKRSRFIEVAGTQALGYGGSIVMLGNAWYKDYDQAPFHSFNDSKEWLQMDKAGHFLTAWYLGRLNMNMLQWSGIGKKKAVWYGAAESFLYLTGIELLDGYSNGWGFSWNDMASNTLGTIFFIVQRSARVNRSCIRTVTGASVQFHSNRNWFTGLSLKYSFHWTGYPDLRPELLGRNFAEQMVKDYNGQTYWLSFNLASAMWEEKAFPKWLNIAFGYGGERMISGHPEFVKLSNGTTVWMERYRQYYLSLDIDLTRIRARSRILKTVFEAISFIKIPAPALEMSKKGMKFHPFYY